MIETRALKGIDPVVVTPVHADVAIDVDGNEAEIVEGALQTLADPRLKSLLIEVRADDREARIQHILASAGLALTAKHGLNHVFVRSEG
jgi:hypothetical protein